MTKCLTFRLINSIRDNFALDIVRILVLFMLKLVVDVYILRIILSSSPYRLHIFNFHSSYII